MKKRTQRKKATIRGMVRVQLAAVILPTFFLSVFLYRSFYSKYYETILTANEATLTAISVAIEDNEKMVEHFIELISYDRDVTDLLRSRNTVYSQIVSRVFDLQELIAEREAMMSRIGADIVIFSENECLPASYWYLLPAESAKEMEGYQQLLESGKTSLWAGEELMYPESTVISKNNRQSVISYYKVIPGSVGERLGTIKCGVQKRHFLEVISTTEVDGELFVIQNGKVIYGNTGKRDIPNLISQGSDTTRTDRNGVIYLSYPINKLNMDIVIALDKGMITQQAIFYGLPQLLIILGTGAVMLLAGRRFTRSIYRRIDQIVSVAQNAKSNYMEVTLPSSDDDDISALVDALNTLIGQIRSNVQARIEHEKKEKNALRLAFQYQMNPHFLFNTLNWIQMCIELGAEPDKTSEGIVILGRLLRYNLNGEVYATVAQETERTRDYIQLMNMRKNNAVSLDIELTGIEPEQQLMRFMLQPLCENAIQHGLVPGRQLHISVRITACGDEVIVCVKNDGTMIEPEMIEEIMDKVQNRQEEIGVGLANIYARIKLLYGETSNMVIQSKPEETSIILYLREVDALQIQEEVCYADSDCR